MAQLPLLPIGSKTFAGIELTLAHMAARKQPAERTFRQIYRGGARRPGFAAPVVRYIAIDRTFDQQPRVARRDIGRVVSARLSNAGPRVS